MTASSFRPSRPPFLFWSAISMRTVSLSTDSLMAMVPDRECRMPTLMVFSSAAAGGTANASCKRSNPHVAANFPGSKLASYRCPYEFEDTGFLSHAFGDDRLESSELKEVLNTQIDLFADQDRGPNCLFRPSRRDARFTVLPSAV